MRSQICFYLMSRSQRSGVIPPQSQPPVSRVTEDANLPAQTWCAFVKSTEFGLKPCTTPTRITSFIFRWHFSFEGAGRTNICHPILKIITPKKHFQRKLASCALSSIKSARPTLQKNKVLSRLSARNRSLSPETNWCFNFSLSGFDSSFSIRDQKGQKYRFYILSTGSAIDDPLKLDLGSCINVSPRIWQVRIT